MVYLKQANLSMELLLKVLTYAKALVNINDEEIDIIIHSRKSLLFNNTYIWMKKNGDPNFNVSMENFDGTELCKLVRLYIVRNCSFNSHQ